MTDICMCKHEGCLKKDYCFRFTAHADDNQSYAMFQCICNEENNYQWFWRNKEVEVEKVGKEENKTD